MIMATKTVESKAARLRVLLATPKYQGMNGPEAAKAAAEEFGGRLPVSAQEIYQARHNMGKKKTARAKPLRRKSSANGQRQLFETDQVEAPAKRQRRGRTFKHLTEGQPFKLSVHIPDEGLVLKLVRKSLAVGTLALSETGFMFVKANGKNAPDREIKWEHLSKLFESGLLG